LIQSLRAIFNSSDNFEVLIFKRAARHQLLEEPRTLAEDLEAEISADEGCVHVADDDADSAAGETLEALGPESLDLEIPPSVPGSGGPHVPGLEHFGRPVPNSDQSRMPPPDNLAFYLPFHYYYPDWWGIYLLYDGVRWLAAEIVRRSRNKVGQRQAFESARLFLYYHEAFHHKTECFATRLELTHPARARSAQGYFAKYRA
jgi:hypothetical protein